MQSATESDTEQCIVLEDTEYLEFVAGSVTDAYTEIHETIISRLPSSPSLRDVEGHVLKGLLRQVPVLSIEDVHELRVLLDVDVPDDASVDEQISTVFQEALQIIAKWQRSKHEQREAPA